MTNQHPTLTLLLFATITIYFIAISSAISTSDQSLSMTAENNSTKRSTQFQAQSQENQTNHDHIALTKAMNKATKQNHHHHQQQQQQQQVNKSQSDRNIQRNNRRNSIAGKRNESLKLNSNRKATSTSAPPFKSGTAFLSTQLVDPFVLAQQEIRRMMSYNNTPPVFITPTRDFFVDVTRYPLGTKLTTIRAVDTDADQLEYSIQPANVRDASAHFSINSSTGELRLANRPFTFYPDSIKRSSIDSNDEDASSQDEDRDDNDNCEEEDADCSANDDDNDADHQFFNRNLYFLNVAVYDGRQTSVVELKIHVTNSSFFALLHSMGANSPVELTPGGSRNANERLNSIIRMKTKEFYDELHKVPSTMPNNTSGIPATIVYPSFINPSLVKPDYDQFSKVLNEREDDFSVRSTTLLSTSTTSSPDNVILKPTNSTLSESGNLHPLDNLHILKTHDNQNPTKTNSVPAGYQVENLSSLPGSVISQPMITSLVLICSCLMITLVLLMFIVPISVKRLRKRLKNVELQHEHLSQRNSTGSSIICSSSTASSMACHKHNPSWQSQFTVNSDNQSSNFRDGPQSVCRQSSLDSSITAANNTALPTSIMLNQRLLNRVNNGSIANPMYLQNQQVGSFANFDDQEFTRSPHLQMISASALPVQISTAHIRDSTQIKHCDNIYCPIEHDYSTINPDIEHPNQMSQAPNQLNNKTGNWTSELIQNNHQPIISQNFLHQELFERPIESPGSDLSSSSLSSLTRFLSLPARHSAHSQDVDQNVTEFELEGDEKSLKPKANNNGGADNDEFDFFKVDKFQMQQVASKTIARASNVARERQTNEKAWELERYKLKFLNPLDKGQFGMVWRCKLKQTFDYEITVAVKTLKNSATKDEREREDLLAEIEIMKLVCDHPNVVKILHCCTTDAILTQNQAIIEKKPIYLVMEYVELGKLQSYLEKSRVNHQYATNHYKFSGATNNEHLTSRDLVKFIYHVAKGMEYISSQCIVHRDLASRNILVSSQKICKIGDFGMARHMKSYGGIYERHSRNSKVPVRWMAPEVLLNNKFTTESDVYSFGILMWEIVTLGSTPYKHLQTEEVIEKVARNGERPEKPKYCHSQLFEIMSKCWSQKPEERPTFKNLVKQLDELLLSANNYIELDQYPDHNYYNIPMVAAPFELL